MFGVTVTVYRTTRDRYGDVTDTTSHTIAGCALAPSSGSSGQQASTENTDRRDTVVSGMILYGPPNADIVATDVVELADGTRWQADGGVGPWNSPWTGWQAGIELALTRATG